MDALWDGHVKLPSSLPLELRYLEGTAEEKTFLTLLLEHSLDHVILFIENAVRDIPWMGDHYPLLNSFFKLLTLAYLQQQLSQDQIDRLIRLIQAHSSSIGPLLPKDLIISSGKAFQPGNSLLLGSQCRTLASAVGGKKRLDPPQRIFVEDVDEETFFTLLKVLEDANSSHLSNRSIAFYSEAFSLAQSMGAPELLTLLEEKLSTEATGEDWESVLILAQRKQLPNVIDACCAIVNAKEKGFRLLREGEHLLLSVENTEVDENFFNTCLKHSESLSFSSKVIQTPLLIRCLTAKLRWHKVSFADTNAIPLPVLETPFLTAYLDLSGCEWLTDPLLTALVDHIPDLEGLFLDDNRQLKSFIGVTHSSALHTLSLANCSQITDNILGGLLPKQSTWRYLTLKGCPSVGDRSAIFIATHGKQLVHLDLSGCQNLSDQGLKILIRECASVTTLELSGCHLITLDGVKQCLREMRSLRTFNASHCGFFGKIGPKDIPPSLRLIV